MKYNLLPWIVVVLILIACNGQKALEDATCQVLSIDIEKETLHSEKPALTKLHYVRLETKEDCLLWRGYKA